MSGRKQCNICPVVVGVQIERYLQSLRTRGYSPKSLSLYRLGLRELDAFLAASGAGSVRDVTAGRLSDYRLSLVERGFKPASLAAYLKPVRGLFRWLEQRHEIFLDPAAGLAAPAVPRQLRRVPSEEEMQALLAAPEVSTPRGVRDRAVMETAYATALRQGELVALRVGSVDLDARTVRIMGKGRRERMAPLGSQAALWLARYLADARPRIHEGAEEALWVGLKGPLSAEGVTAIFLRHSRTAGISPPIRTHAVRRACATHMLRAGAGPAELQALLGHASLRHLSQYLAVTITELRRMHERSRLGA